MVKTCANCPTQLVGLQKKFCSQRCKNTFGGSERYKLRNAEYAEYRKKYYSEKREEILRQKSEYYQANKDEIKIKNTEHKKLYPEADDKYNKSVKGKYRDYKTGALKRGLVFELSIEYFQENWEKNCYYCGDKIVRIGLDRIDNDIGYTVANTVNCCGTCNYMKRVFDQDYFINQCKKIAKLWE